MNTKLGSALALLVVSLLAACGGDDGGDDGDESMTVTLSSGSECTDSSLTYDNFAKDYFGNYCTRCHSGDLSGTARSGAPQSVNFDTLAEAKAIGAFTIDKKAVLVAGSAPVMPPSPPLAPADEREKLGIWLACGMH